MAYQSVHSGPAIDAAVTQLADIQIVRDESNANLATVQNLAAQVATDAGTASTAAASATQTLNDATAAIAAADHARQEQIDAEIAIVADQRFAAEQAATEAVAAAGAAVATVTQDMAASVPTPNKLPLADAQGKIASGWVGFQQSGAGAAARTMQDKAREIVSVLDFGAVGDGVTDDTAAFQAAASAAVGYNINTLAYGDMPAAPFACIYVPVGEYTLTSEVDPHGKDIIWRLATGAKISGIEFINGRVVQDGLRTNAEHHGILDHAVTVAFKAHRNGLGGPASVTGITHPRQLASYKDRDSVTTYADNRAPAPTAICAGASFTATSLVPVSPVSAAKLRIGMIVDTDHSPNRYSGVIVDWEQDGSVIYVTAWYEVTGTSNQMPSTPPDGATAYINAYTKVWTHNSQIELAEDSHATKGCGWELNIRNSKVQIADPTDTTNDLYGVDVVSFGPYNAGRAYLSRGAVLWGYESRGAVRAGFVATKSHTGGSPEIGYANYTQSYYQFLGSPRGYGTIGTFGVRDTGSVELGARDLPQTLTMDWRTGGLNQTYDARISVAGGNTGTGAATVQLTAAVFEINPRSATALRPATDNEKGLGDSTRRFSTSYVVKRFYEPGIFDSYGLGSPEGVVVASVGSTYRRTNGTAGETFYVKESGFGTNTGWVAK